MSVDREVGQGQIWDTPVAREELPKERKEKGRKPDNRVLSLERGERGPHSGKSGHNSVKCHR